MDKKKNNKKKKHFVLSQNQSQSILKAKSNFTVYIYTKKLLAIFLLKSWEML